MPDRQEPSAGDARNPAPPVRIAIVGCGAVSQELHAPSLVALERRGLATVAWISDPSPTSVDAMSALFPQARTCPSLDGVADAGCDVALVASPVSMHGVQTIRCLEAGLHVLCEKPIALTSAEADRMIAASKATGRLLAVGHVRRFFTASQWIREAVTTRRFGKPRGFTAIEGGAFAWPAKSAGFFDRSTNGGGVLIDNGIHALDLLIWWFGDPVGIAYRDDAMGGIETNCRVDMDFGDFTGSLQLSWDFQTPVVYRLEFEHAWIKWQPYTATRLELGFPGMDHALEADLVPADPRLMAPRATPRWPDYFEAFLPEWMNFLAAVRGQEDLVVPAAEAVKSLQVVENCYRQASFLEPPWFSDRERTEARRRRGEAV
jgi:predicted dehydrogenase